MKTIFEMSLHIKALSKQRPRTGKSGHFFTPNQTKQYEQAVREAAQVFYSDAPTSKPVFLTVEIKHAAPKSWPTYKREWARRHLIYPKRGDLDNKVKAVSDALNGIIYIDDIQVVESYSKMVYGSDNLLYVRVAEVGNDEAELQRMRDEGDNKGGFRMGG